MNDEKQVPTLVEKIRLDQKTLEALPSLSRASVIKLIKDGKVSVNGVVITKAGSKVYTTDAVTVDYDTETLAEIPEINLPVLYEDDDCVVIDKPEGILTHSKGAFNPEATVATWLSKNTKGFESDGQRNGIVHRLDRATSGVMICAKTPEALSWLQKQFSTRKVKKTYIAIIEGKMDPPEAVINMPIERNPKQPQRFRVGSNGKASVTEYYTKKNLEDFTLLQLRPLTGRTHQLRVHLAYQGHPIVGDTFYSGKPAERLYLHAHKLELTLPNRERKVFISKVPASFEEPK